MTARWRWRSSMSTTSRRSTTSPATPTGDRVLATLGARLHGLLRSEDLLARIGGDEFALLMPETEERQARIVLERARVELERAPLVDDIRVRISAGICELSRAGDGDDAHAARRRRAVLEQGARPQRHRGLRPGDRPRAVGRPSASTGCSARRRSPASARSRARSTPRTPPPASTPSAWPHSQRGWPSCAAGAPSEWRCCTRRRWSTTSARSASRRDPAQARPARPPPSTRSSSSTPRSAPGSSTTSSTAEQVELDPLAPRAPRRARLPGRAPPAIPEGAALLAVADCFDVMTVARPYSRAMAPEAARWPSAASLVGAQFTADGPRWPRSRRMRCNRYRSCNFEGHGRRAVRADPPDVRGAGPRDRRHRADAPRDRRPYVRRRSAPAPRERCTTRSPAASTPGSAERRAWRAAPPPPRWLAAAARCR